MANNYNTQLEEACAKFRKILEDQLVRVEDMKAQGDFVDYSALETLRIGVCGGDGIGPVITDASERVLRTLLADEIKSGKIEIRNIDQFKKKFCDFVRLCMLL